MGTTTPTTDRRESRPWVSALLESSAPVRPPWRTIAIGTVASAVALLVLAGMTELTAEPFLIPPLAASMALVVGAPQLPLSQPRHVIGGQVVSATVGVIAGAVLGHSLWVGALAGALALAAMLVFRVAHSPAAATAVIGVTTAVAAWEFVLVVAVAAVVLVAVGIAGNKANGAKYPSYLW